MAFLARGAESARNKRRKNAPPTGQPHSDSRAQKFATATGNLLCDLAGSKCLRSRPPRRLSQTVRWKVAGYRLRVGYSHCHAQNTPCHEPLTGNVQSIDQPVYRVGREEPALKILLSQISV